eukprot:c19926_g5_i1 orf=193-882(-)
MDRACKSSKLFQQMQLGAVAPDKFTFVSILSACGSLEALLEGRCLHSLIICRGFQLDIPLGNALINMYAKCGCVEDARRVFNTMPERNVVSWSTIISAYAQNGQGKEVLLLYQQIQLGGVIPDKFTFAGVLSACASQADLAQGKSMHTHIISTGFEPDVVMGTAIVNMYSKCGSLGEAQRIFDGISERDEVLWSAVIAACFTARAGKGGPLSVSTNAARRSNPNRIHFC